MKPILIYVNAAVLARCMGMVEPTLDYNNEFQTKNKLANNLLC